MVRTAIVWSAKNPVCLYLRSNRASEEYKFSFVIVMYYVANSVGKTEEIS